MSDSSTRSLRLFEVLNDEYERHAAVFPEKKHPTLTRSPVSEKEIYVPDAEKLEARVQAVRPNGGGGLEWARRKRAGSSGYEPSDYPYWKLAGWMQGPQETTPADDSAVLTVSELSAAEALRQQLTTPTAELLRKETWLRDTASRSFTRGLLKSYDEQNPPYAWQKEPGWSENQGLVLNQLLLEDAFIGHVRPAETVQLEDVLAPLPRTTRRCACQAGCKCLGNGT